MRLVCLRQEGSEIQTKQRRLRILLVNPPYYRLFKNTYAYNKYPLSLGYLAGAVKRKTDCDVTVYNADFAPFSEDWTVQYLCGAGFNNYRRNLHDPSYFVWTEVKSVINESRPAVIGIYCCAANSTSTAVVAKLAKEANQKSTIVLGGPHPTSIGREALNDPNIDIIVKGEGEQTITELLDKIGNDEPFDAVKGVIYRTASGQIVETANRDLIKDLNVLAFPHACAKEVLKDYEKYPASAFNNILATRGCPYNCFFCGSRSVFGRKTRFRSVENVTNEIRSLQRIGVRWVAFLDDSFGVNREYTHELCNSLIRNCPKILWECETRVDLVEEETIALMKKAGCREIHFGLESGSNQMLEEMRKQITVEQAFSAARIIRKYGIRLRANFLVGFPTETLQTIKDTFAAMKGIKGMVTYSIFTPYPGTEAFEYCRERGLIKGKEDMSLYNHQSPENCFCMNMNRKQFRRIASEMEKYVDKQNTVQNLKQIFSLKFLEDVRNYGGFRNTRSFSNLTRELIVQLKGLLASIVHAI